ncbi:MAG: hypothetical protein JW867_04835 [Candidatus Omnitrophica bacterium]|nr:hypothetical protein [Candidatus Omnitrophota bacterium]
MLTISLDQIMEKCSSLPICEERRITDDYKELVFYTKDTEHWNKMLTEALGPALKPQGVKPTPDIQEIAKNYGGIHFNQTLYKYDNQDKTIIIMFWPWQDNAHTTMKMISLNKF